MKIAITNLKGGVGKTTISVNLAVALTQRGKSVCIVDTDIQKSSVEWATVRNENKSIIQIFPFDIKQINLRQMEDLEKKFDVVILDGSPQVSELATRTIIVSDLVFIPLNPSLFDFKAFEKFISLVNETNKNKISLGVGCIKPYIILNKINEKTKVSIQIIEGLQQFDVPILQAKLTTRTAYAETTLDGIGVTEGKDKKASDEFNKLTDEIETLINNF